MSISFSLDQENMLTTTNTTKKNQGALSTIIDSHKMHAPDFSLDNEEHYDMSVLNHHEKRILNYGAFTFFLCLCCMYLFLMQYSLLCCNGNVKMIRRNHFPQFSQNHILQSINNTSQFLFVNSSRKLFLSPFSFYGEKSIFNKSIAQGLSTNISFFN
jgi:hypothetical protein